MNLLRAAPRRNLMVAGIILVVALVMMIGYDGIATIKDWPDGESTYTARIDGILAWESRHSGWDSHLAPRAVSREEASRIARRKIWYGVAIPLGLILVAVLVGLHSTCRMLFSRSGVAAERTRGSPERGVEIEVPRESLAAGRRLAANMFVLVWVLACAGMVLICVVTLANRGWFYSPPDSQQPGLRFPGRAAMKTLDPWIAGEAFEFADPSMPRGRWTFSRGLRPIVGGSQYPEMYWGFRITADRGLRSVPLAVVVDADVADLVARINGTRHALPAATALSETYVDWVLGPLQRMAQGQ